MADWQLIYWTAQLTTFAAFARIAVLSLETYIKTRNSSGHEDGRLVLWIFFAVAVLFLAKDAFWAIIVFRPDWLPNSLYDPYVLAWILAAIQTAAAVWFTVFWERVS